MLPVLFFTASRRHRIRAVVATGALVAGLATVLSPSSPALASTPKGTLLPISSTGDIVVDGSHQRIFIADPADDKVIAVGYNGSVLGTARQLPGVVGLALSPDESTLYAAAVNGDAIVAIDTESVTETARYATGANSEPTYLAPLGGKIWFGYRGAGNTGLGSFDPAIGESSVILGQEDTNWAGPPIVAATSGRLALAAHDATQGVVKILDVTGDSPKTVASKTLDDTYVRDLTFSPDGNQLLTATFFPFSGDGVVNSWRTSDLAKSVSYAGAGHAGAVTVAPDGRLAVGSFYSAENRPRVHVFLPGTTTPVRQITLAHTSTEIDRQDDIADRGLVWEPNGTRLFAISSAYPNKYRLVVLTDPTLSEPKLTVSAPATSTRAKTLTVTGSLTASLPLPAGTGVTVTRTDGESPDGTSLGVKKIDAKGRLSFTDKPAAGGKITYELSYAGDTTHLSATASGSVKVSKDAAKLTLSGNRKVHAYGSKTTFTAKLGKAYTNRTVEIWADPAGKDQKNRLIKKGKVSSKGTIKATLKLTRNTAVTAVYSGDTRTAAKTVKSSAYTKVRIAMAVSKHYKTTKIGSTKYYVFHKTKDPLFTTTMTAAKGRSQNFWLEYYYEGDWHYSASQYFKLSSKGKSAVSVIGTHQTNLKLRVRSTYVRGSSGDYLNATTRGSWRYFIFTD
jgi:hypothetical protein